ncbi:hypothetical protein [Treponema sp. C6A8]|uniref:hypothetical protein n=1 Tax=Treponema sp. C6A8 TaxID=1410609 RepID=UPI0006842173|nr:hypothetical protein [Treponema sp. C6A8]
MEVTYPIVRKTYQAAEIEIDPGEVLRYLGYKKDLVTAEDISQVEAFIPEARAAIKPAACWGRFAVQLHPKNKITFPYGEVISKDLSRNLAGCSEIFLFAATIGLEYDRLVQRARISSMAKASFLNAIGAASVENVCDQLNEELRQLAAGEGKSLRPRYSAGYGDYTLENQRGIFDLLTPSKYIGLALKDNLIMVPEKSVTAVIGIEIKE